MEYLLDTHLVSEKEYYYHGRMRYRGCMDTSNLPGPKLKAAYGVHKDPGQMKAALYWKGPMTVGANADDAIWRDYAGGIIDDPYCSDEIGHAMVAVGFGKD